MSRFTPVYQQRSLPIVQVSCAKCERLIAADVDGLCDRFGGADSADEPHLANRNQRLTVWVGFHEHLALTLHLESA